MIKQCETEWGYEPTDWHTISRARYNKIVDRVMENVSQAQRQQKQAFDKRVKCEDIKIGDEVWVRCIRRQDKLAPIWVRGWFVKKIINLQTVVIVNKRKEERVVNKEKIRKLIICNENIETPRVQVELDGDGTRNTGIQIEAAEDIPQPEDIPEDMPTPGTVSEAAENPTAVENNNQRPQRARLAPQRFIHQTF
jgi:hypothetical protein